MLTPLFSRPENSVTFPAALRNTAQKEESGAPEIQSDFIETALEVNLANIGERYADSIRAIRGDHAHCVDRLPFNFLYLGLIRLALPKAKIVHVRRDPMDSCYAIYRTHFDTAFPYSYDLSELARYYVAYDRLMSHWHAVMPGVIHELRYEDLITDAKTVIQDLLDHCDLSWETACLDFASRAELNPASFGLWSRYRAGMEPARKILNNAAVATDSDVESSGSKFVVTIFISALR